MTPRRLANLLGAAAGAVQERIDDALREASGLSGEAPAAVLTVGTRPGRPIKDLSRSLGLSHSGTVRLVDRLEGRGWVVRERSADGREVHLRLTDAGEEMFEKLSAARRAVLERLVEPVPADDRGALGRALEALLTGLVSDRDDAWHICRLCEHRVCRGADCPVGSAADAAERVP